MGNVESDTETSSNGSGRLRRRSFSSGQTNSKELGHKRSFINKVLTRAGSSSSIGERRPPKAKERRKSSIHNFLRGITGVVEEKKKNGAPVSWKRISTSPMKPLEKKSDIELESVILSRFDQESDGYLTEDQILRASKVLLRSSEQPSADEVKRMFKACKIKRSAGIKISQFSSIWVRIVKKQEELSQNCTDIAVELRNLETTLQEVVLKAEDRDELLLIQETFRLLQESEDVYHLGYLTIKKNLYQSFDRDFVDTRKPLLKKFLQITTDIREKRENFVKIESRSAWDEITKEIEDRKRVVDVGKDIFKACHSPKAQ